MSRKTTWMTVRLFLQIAGGAALLAWLLFAPYALSARILSAFAVGLFLAALYPLLAALERRRIRRDIAEKICNASFVRTPRWNDRPVEEYALRGPAVKALMAEHNRIARDLESLVVARGYRRRDTRKAIAIGRYELGMYSYEALLGFVLKNLSAEYPDITQITEGRRTVGGRSPQLRSTADRWFQQDVAGKLPESRTALFGGEKRADRSNNLDP
jgi:hypothetical protein